jgi:hypothetical protein
MAKTPTAEITTTQEASQSDLQKFLGTLITSKQLPSHIKTVAEAFTIAQMGKELGFPTMQAFHYIIPIQGKLSLSAKAIGALLRKGGVRYITQEDGVWVYADGSTSTIIKPGDEKPIDQRTTILFLRDGMEERCSFSWKDAEKQGLTTKDNWKRMPKEMLYARCVAKGANRIGSDLLLGLYAIEELADSFSINESHITRNEDGSIASIIDTEATIIK